MPTLRVSTWWQSLGLSLLVHFWFDSDPSPSELIFPSHWMLVRLLSSGKHSVSFFTDSTAKNISENTFFRTSTSSVLAHPSPFSRSSLGSVDRHPRGLLSSELVLLLSRMNLFRPWGPHSFPLAVRALMTLCRSAAFGITTTRVSGMVGWSIMRMPSGKQRVVDGVGVTCSEAHPPHRTLLQIHSSERAASSSSGWWVSLGSLSLFAHSKRPGWWLSTYKTHT